MKKLVQFQEVEGEGMEALMGQNVTLFCGVYIYHGKLTGVNDEFVLIENAHIVYATGPFPDAKFKDAQKLGDEWRVQKSAIESYGAFASKN